MEKIFRVTSNSLLTMFLFGLMLIPIASMGMIGVKPQNKDVLSAQDKSETEEVRETTGSIRPALVSPEQVNN